MGWRDSSLGTQWGRARLRAEHRYYLSLAPVRGVHPREEPAPLLDDWVRSLGDPTRIVVVAAGPTAADLRPEPGWLHVATNSSEKVVLDHPYVYFLSESHPVDRYLKQGPRSANCRGTFFRFETRGVPERHRALARRTIAFSRASARPAPDVIASNLLDAGPEHDNFDVFEDRVRTHLGQPVKQYNSGVGATYLGYFLAVTLGVPLDLYGLDAGEGGKKHFDGSQMASPSVVGDRVRTKLADLHALLRSQDHVPVTNHSAFLPYGPSDGPPDDPSVDQSVDPPGDPGA